ncbi:MAG: hypothetical protein L6Q76_10740 [Polyangiaceae bacterium]|nr:hypothetical protein [Polyangiaceae bacterium]
MSFIRATLDPTLAARIVEVRPLGPPDMPVRAGSALLRAGDRLLVVQDDAFEIVWIDLPSLSLDRVALHSAGSALPKHKKPDFEAAFTGPDGTLVIIGSASAPQRRFIARIESSRAEAEIVDSGALFDAVAEALGTTPNIEGAALAGENVTLLHRGSGGAPFANAAVDVPLEAFFGGAPKAGNVRRFDLGSIDGVALTFTDAAPLEGDRLLYLAVAEDTPDAIADGPVLGGAVGVIEPGGARYTRLVLASGEPFTGKAEGIALDAGGRSGFLVTDPDSPDRPAELCRLELKGSF